MVIFLKKNYKKLIGILLILIALALAFFMGEGGVKRNSSKSVTTETGVDRDQNVASSEKGDSKPGNMDEEDSDASNDNQSSLNKDNSSNKDSDGNKSESGLGDESGSGDGLGSEAGNGAENGSGNDSSNGNAAGSDDDTQTDYSDKDWYIDPDYKLDESDNGSKKTDSKNDRDNSNSKDGKDSGNSSSKKDESTSGTTDSKKDETTSGSDESQKNETTSGTDDSKNDENITTENKQYVTISISCATVLKNKDKLDRDKLSIIPSDGWILKPEKVEIKTGTTVFDVIEQVTKQHKISFEYTYTPLYGSSYIEGIGNLYEFDCGELSGWMYSVNGSFPSFGSSKYVVKNGDVIRFVYTCDLGADVGDDSYSE